MSSFFPSLQLGTTCNLFQEGHDIIQVHKKAFKDKAEAKAQLRGHSDLLYWTDPPGTLYEPHTHPHEENIYILKGSMRFTVR